MKSFHKSFRTPSFLALAVAAALAGCAATQDAGHSAMNMVKSATGQAQVVRQDVAPALYQVAYSPSENVVYAVSAGNPKDPASGVKSKLFKLDPETLAVKAEIELPKPGYGLTLDDEAHRLYIVDTRGGTLMVYDTTLGQVTSSVTMPPVLDAQGKPEKIEYREIVVDKANHRLYLPAMSYHDSKLQVVNLDTLTVERTIPGFNFGATGISMDSGAGKLYVSNLMGQLFVVDIGTLAITDRFEVQGDQLLNLVVDHDNKRLLAVDQGFDRLDVVRKERGGLNYQTRTQGNQVLALDPSSGKVLQNIKVGTQPVAMLLDAPRNRLYVSNRVSSNISVVDPRTGQEIKTIDLPTHPNSFALNPKTGTVYVTVKLPKEKSMTDKESVARISF